MTIRFNGVRIKPCATGGGGGSSANISNFATITGDVSTKFLAHFDGSNGSTTFVDDSSNSLSSATFSGGAVVSTAQSKFGGSSLSLDGFAASKLSIANTNNKVNFDGDFTLEGWCYLNSVSGIIFLFSLATDDDYQGPVLLYNYVAGQLSFIASTTLGPGWEYFLNTSGASIATGSWVHVAVVGKYLSSIKVYVNGVERASTAYSTKIVIKNNGYIYPGHYPYYNSTTPVTMDGYIDELRYSSVARYNGNFTPASSAFASAAFAYPTAELGLMAKDSSGNLYECTSVSPVTWKEYSSTGVTYTP